MLTRDVLVCYGRVGVPGTLTDIRGATRVSPIDTSAMLWRRTTRRIQRGLRRSRLSVMFDLSSIHSLKDRTISLEPPRAVLRWQCAITYVCLEMRVVKIWRLTRRERSGRDPIRLPLNRLSIAEDERELEIASPPTLRRFSSAATPTYAFPFVPIV